MNLIDTKEKETNMWKRTSRKFKKYIWMKNKRKGEQLKMKKSY